MPGDEDNWKLKYAPHYIRWLVGKHRATGMNYYEILWVEMNYPNLLDDTEIYEWQELLITDAMKAGVNGGS